MKTGLFAQTYNLTSNGIRYYVEQGLLAPEKVGNQYRFDQNCVDTMEQIQYLKQMNFSIPEISRIFHTRRLSQYTTDSGALRNYNKIFEQKKEELQEQIEMLKLSIGMIDHELEKVAAADDGATTTGLPLDCLNLLCCPHCGTPLSFNNSKIKNNHMLQADILCDCGYTARLDNGIIVGNQNNPQKVEWSNIANLTTECSLDYINLETKSYFDMKEYIKKHFSGGQISGTVFTSGGYAGNFICAYSQLFADDTTIIIADQSLDAVTHVKNKMGRLNLRFKLVYLCDESFTLPLKNNCIDVFLDDFSSSEYIFYDASYPFEKIRPFLHKDAFLGGIYTYYHSGTKTLAQIEHAYPRADINLFTVGTLKSRLKKNGVHTDYERNLGQTKNPGTGYSFPYHNPNDPLCFYIYFGTKVE